MQGNAALFVRASDVTIRGLRFIWRFDGVSVLVGADGREGPPPRQAVRNILIEGNVFGLEGGSPAEHSGVRVYMEPEGKAVGASIENVRVQENTFLRAGGPIGVVVAANGSNCEIRGVVIEDNNFTDLASGGISVECAQGSGNSIRGTRILRNRFVSETGQHGVIVFHLVDPLPPRGTFASHNLIDGTRIEGNFLLNSALEFFGGQNGATNNTISNTEVNNNVVVNGAIAIFGGKWEATGNRIETLRFVNNTVLGLRVGAAPDVEGGSGNSVSGLSFVNTIIAPETGLVGIAPSAFSYCLTGNSDIVAGGIHNLLGDPLFVDRAAGDFHLQSGSPAIDAGTSDGVPPVDFECRPRVAVVDIGAFEYGAPDVALLGLSVAEGVGVTVTVPDGFRCGSAVSFPRDAIVSIVATPAPGWRFVGWRGDDDCIDGTVTMSSDRRCVAAFAGVRRRAVRSN